MIGGVISYNYGIVCNKVLMKVKINITTILVNAINDLNNTYANKQLPVSQ